jgi:uncharacterized protein (DUF427 family)
MRDLMFRELGALRHEPIDKRIRGFVGDEAAVDSTRARLVWEPRRVVASYAVPLEDVAGELEPAADGAPEAVRVPELAGRPVYDPSVPFAVHTAPGSALRLRVGDRSIAAFRPDDEALRDVVVLDFDGFDAWYEEDEPNLAHPRDPFHRIDILRSSRHVRIEAGGRVLGETDRPRLLFEPPLPVRYYLPPEDVRTDLLTPSDTRSRCAYKGEAHYVSADGTPDVAWTYPAPLREAEEITGCYAFFNEQVDITVDGVRLERPVTPWSR